jgi:uncharacterized protein (DUF433 family)
MQLPPFLTQDELGEIRLQGSRIGLYHLIWYYKDGFSAEQLHDEFPNLGLDLIHQVLAFYQAHRSEVDEYVAREQAAIDHLRATTPRRVDWEELRKRMEERRTKEVS